jgi:hypothetical protein
MVIKHSRKIAHQREWRHVCTEAPVEANRASGNQGYAPRGRELASVEIVSGL